MPDSLSLDTDAINTLKGLMKDRFGFLIDTFIEKTSKQIVDLKSAIDTNNTDEIIAITHGLKGSAGSVGAQSVHELCKQYETDARANQLENAHSWAQALETEYERYITDIQVYL